jgi:hypothetical protein
MYDLKVLKEEEFNYFIKGVMVTKNDMAYPENGTFS